MEIVKIVVLGVAGIAIVLVIPLIVIGWLEIMKEALRNARDRRS